MNLKTSYFLVGGATTQFFPNFGRSSVKLKRSTLKARAWGMPLGRIRPATEVVMKRVTEGHQMDQSS